MLQEWGMGVACLLHSLLEGIVPEECAKCIAMLKKAGFSMASFQQAVQGDRDTQSDQPVPQHPQHNPRDWASGGSSGSSPGVSSIPSVAPDPRLSSQTSQRPRPTHPTQDVKDVVVENVKSEDIEGSQSADQRPGVQDLAAEPEPSIDVRALVRKLPFLELLPENTNKRRYPVRCHACVRPTTKQPAIFDLITLKHDKFLNEHCNGPTHARNLAFWRLRHACQATKDSDKKSHGSGGGGSKGDTDDDGDGDEEGQEVQSKDTLHECQAFQLQNAPEGAKLASVLPAFELWASYNVLSAAAPLCDGNDAGHKYHHDLGAGHYSIRHRHCNKQAGLIVEQGVPALCEKCRNLGDDRYILRSLNRFFVKHSAAHLLKGRLFAPESVPGITDGLRQSCLYLQGFKRDLGAAIALELYDLQRFVNTQFKSVPRTKWGKALTDFVECVVEPCLKVHSWNATVANNAQTLAAKLKTGALATLDEVNLKLACQVASGALNEHPVVQGLLVAAVEQTLRSQQGTSGIGSCALVTWRGP